MEFVDRGDPASEDFDQTDIDIDKTWTDIDLSSIVPVGTVAVLLAVELRAAVANVTLQFRKKGNANFLEGNGMTTQVDAQSIRSHFWIACDTNRKIQYFRGAGEYTKINISVIAYIV